MSERANRMLYNSIDEYYMARCLELAAQGAGFVSPNPMVGAVVLDAHGQKVGEGYHQRVGEGHAEIAALAEAGARATGGTLYVNLEPCNHHGRTPPCTSAVIESGVERVVCGTLDPNPLVAGKGRDALQNARISVRHGFLETECQRLNEVFFHYITTEMPFVTVKLAMTMDGKIAARSGESRWLTGEFSRQYVHHLRHGVDAVLTTAETVLKDDPELTVRDVPHVRRQPVRVVLDRQMRLKAGDYKIFRKTAPTWIFTSQTRRNEENLSAAREAGVKIFEVPEAGEGLDLKAVMATLGKEKIANVFVEAGGKLAQRLRGQDLIQKYLLFYAPKIMNDPMAKPAFGNALHLDVPGAPHLEIANTRQLENDLVIEAYPAKAAAGLKI